MIHNETIVVGRHIAAGGNLKISGSGYVGHDLRVDGWLDAPNLTGAAKGLFASAERLAEAYPDPQPGWWALVGEGLPARLYMAAPDGTWTDTGSDAGAVEINPRVLTDLTEEAAESAAQAADSADRAAKSLGACAGEADRLAAIGEELSASADMALAQSWAAGILPFDGFNPWRGGARPVSGVWFVEPDAEGYTSGRFEIVTAPDGFSSDDYNTVGSDGTVVARRDRVFRLGGRLYRFDGTGLVPYASGSEIMTDSAAIEACVAAGITEPGRFYCVVNPLTRRVEALYIG